MTPAWMVALLGASLVNTRLLATLTYRYVEIPGRTWLRPRSRAARP